MSLLGSMRTGVSGMNAQSVRIGSVAENIANAGTTGFKRTDVEFESLLGSGTDGSFAPGAVGTHVRYHVAQQGAINPTSSTTDLAIDGDGFFVVKGNDGETLLTRAGSFIPDSEGRLINSAGHFLMGIDALLGNSLVQSLEVVRIPSNSLVSSPSSQGLYSANLPSGAPSIGSDRLPSMNLDNAEWNAKSSTTVYDNLGAAMTVDIYFSKLDDSSWEVSMFDRSGASAGGHPYLAGSLFSGVLEFGEYGELRSGGMANFDVPNGSTVSLDFSGMKHLAAPFSVIESNMNGGPPVRAIRLEVSDSGDVSTVYEDGRRVISYRIPLANVTSPSQLISVGGNAYAESVGSGQIRLGHANQDGFGEVVSSALDNSTVDIATELTNMIEAQRNFTANSRVFQTSSELLDVLNRL